MGIEVKVYDGSFSATRWSQQLRTYLAGKKDVYERVHTILSKPLSSFTQDELNERATKRALSIVGSTVYQYIDESLHYLLNGNGHDKDQRISLADDTEYDVAPYSDPYAMMQLILEHGDESKETMRRKKRDQLHAMKQKNEKGPEHMKTFVKRIQDCAQEYVDLGGEEYPHDVIISVLQNNLVNDTIMRDMSLFPVTQAKIEALKDNKTPDEVIRDSKYYIQYLVELGVAYQKDEGHDSGAWQHASKIDYVSHQGTGSNYHSEHTCYKCGKKGHIARNCPEQTAGQNSFYTRASFGRGGFGRGRGRVGDRSIIRIPTLLPACANGFMFETGVTRVDDNAV